MLELLLGLAVLTLLGLGTARRKKRLANDCRDERIKQIREPIRRRLNSVKGEKRVPNPDDTT